MVQRARPKTVSGIGSWESIASALTYLAVVTNVALFQFTFGGTFSSADIWEQVSSRDGMMPGTNASNITLGSFETGALSPPAPGTGSEASTYDQVTEWFDLAFTTHFSRLWALIVLEHICVLAKILLGYLVSNEPRWVTESVRNMKRLERLQAEREEAIFESTISKVSSEVNGADMQGEGFAGLNMQDMKRILAKVVALQRRKSSE